MVYGNGKRKEEDRKESKKREKAKSPVVRVKAKRSDRFIKWKFKNYYVG